RTLTGATRHPLPKGEAQAPGFRTQRSYPRNAAADATRVGREIRMRPATPVAQEPQFSASFSALPALNAGTFDALILMVTPVRGLRPVRAARLRTTKVPKPTSETSSPFFSARLI